MTPPKWITGDRMTDAVLPAARTTCGQLHVSHLRKHRETLGWSRETSGADGMCAMAIPLTAPLRLRRALDGLEPAEVLPPAERDRLMRILCGYGWTDVHIAVHTLWTTYTVVRIRERLGLIANVQKGAA